MIFTQCPRCHGFFHKPVRRHYQYIQRSKICIYCVREKARDYYHRLSKTHPVYLNRLRHNQIWIKNNREKIKSYQKRYEKLNREQRARKKHEYYLKNRDEILQRNKIWKEKNRKPKNRLMNNLDHPWRNSNQSIKKESNDTFRRSNSCLATQA